MGIEQDLEELANAVNSDKFQAQQQVMNAPPPRRRLAIVVLLGSQQAKPCCIVSLRLSCTCTSTHRNMHPATVQVQSGCVWRGWQPRIVGGPGAAALAPILVFCLC